jgi:uncharacterized membrane protein YkvA (DUF1232 family)
MDVIPDAIPFLGYLDDAIVGIVLFVVTKRILKNFGLEDKK